MPMAVAGWVATTFLAAAPALGITVAGIVGWTAAGLTALAISAGLAKASASLMGRPRLGAGMRSRRLVIRESTEPRTIVYGECITGGVLAYVNTTGTKNEFLDFVVAVAGHEITEISDVWFDDERIPAAAINGGDPAGGAVGTYTNSDVSPAQDGRYRPRGGTTIAYVYKYLGTATQTASTVLTTAYPKEWTTDHTLRGVAYVHIRLRRNSDAYEQGPPQNFRFKIKGAKVYDPRKDSTNGGTGSHRYEIPSTWEYSNNTALCVADYLIGGTITNAATRTNMRGFGASTSDLDWGSVITAANVCAEPVLIPPAGSPSTYQNRYTCDGALSMGEATSENLEQMLTSMLGQVVYTSGTYRVYAGAYDTPTLTLDEDDLAGPLSFATGTPRSERYNAVKGTRWDSDNGQEVEFLPRTSTSYETDDGARLYRDIELPFTTDEYTAQRIAQIILRRSREQQTLIWKGNLGCLRVGVWETVSVSAAELGLSGKVFRCISRNITMDGEDAIVELTLREEFSTTYADPLIADYGDLTPAEPVAVPSDALDPPANLTATGVAGGILFEITPDDSNGTTVLYELWEHSSSTPVASASLIWAGAATSVAIPKSDQVTRYYWVRCRRNSSYSSYYPDGAGVAGTALEAGTGPQGDPGVSVQLTRVHSAVFAYADGTLLANALDNANGYMRLYEGATLVDTASIAYSVTGQVGCTGTINSSGYYAVTAMSADEATLQLQAIYNGATYTALYTLSKTKAGYEIVNGLPGTNLFDGRLVYLTTDGKLYRYVQGTGWTTAVPAVDITGTLTGLQIGSGTIDITKFASGIQPVIIASSPPSPATEGMHYYDTDDKKLYRYNGTSWTAAVASTDISGTLADAQIAALAASKITGQLTDAQIAAIAAAKLTGQITSTQITDSAITSAKIAANTITAANIAAGAITTEELAANSVTATAIAAGSVTTAKIAAGAVTANEIAALSITGDRIAANTITGAKIAADTITAGNIAAGAISTSELAAGAVTAAKIQAGSITANEIASNTITSNNIQAGTITAAQMATNTITAASAILADAVITTAKIQDLAVDTIKINNGAVTAGYTSFTDYGSGVAGPYAFSTFNYYTLTLSGSAVQLAMSGVPTSNARVAIWFFANCKRYGSSAEDVRIRCYRTADGAILTGTPVFLFTADKLLYGWQFIDENPAYAAPTYQFQVQKESGGAGYIGTWYAVSLFGTVFKK